MLSILCHVYFLNRRKLFPLNSIRKLKSFEIRKVDRIMTYLHVRNVEKFKLQREFYRWVGNICSNYGGYRITEIRIMES